MAEMSAVALRCIRAYELPPQMRRNADEVQHLFASMFGPVDTVVLEDTTKGQAVVLFAHHCSVEACLNRIVQHEVLNEPPPSPGQWVDSIEEGIKRRCNDAQVRAAEDAPPAQAAGPHDGEEDVQPSDDDAKDPPKGVELFPAHWRRGYVYLGYFRILVEGGVRVSLSPDDAACDASGQAQAQVDRTGRAMKKKSSGASKRPRSDSIGTSKDAAADVAGPEQEETADPPLSSSGDNSSESDDDDDDNDGDGDDETNSEASQSPRDKNQQRNNAGPSSSPSASPSMAAARTPPPNCLVLLRMVELPVPSSGTLPGASGMLSPLIVYQMLRDVCLPLKIVLCRKQANAHSGRGGRGGGGGGSAYEARNVLVQVSKPESVAAVVQAFNGIVVELMEAGDGGAAAAQGGSGVPRQQPARATTVAARFRVLACESKHTDGRQNELNVPMNLPGCLSVSQQSIMKMGGVFDRQWELPRGDEAALLGVNGDEGVGGEHGDQQQGEGAAIDGVAEGQEDQPQPRSGTPSTTHHQYHQHHHHHLPQPIVVSVGATHLPRPNVNANGTAQQQQLHRPPTTGVHAVVGGQPHPIVQQQQHQWYLQGPSSYQQQQHYTTDVQQQQQQQQQQRHDTFQQPQYAQHEQHHRRDEGYGHAARQQDNNNNNNSGDRNADPSSSSVGWRWTSVFSDEYQRTYYVATHVATGEQRTAWVLPPDAVLSEGRHRH